MSVALLGLPQTEPGCLVPTWGVLPVGALRSGKSRLASVLSPAERETFILETLERTLGLLGTAPSLEAVVVVSPDEAVRALAARRGAAVLRDVREDLNAALEEATLWAQAEDAERLLILAADLPLLGSGDLEALLGLESGPSVCIAPCKDESGTNALAVRPPGLLRYRFGPQSFAAHCRAAHAAGAHLRVVRSRSLSFDIDTPRDYSLLRQWREKAVR
ncbi:MAG: 2-phospho-L-lactate guanylyltransferase [Candidatus Tectomicrobia bacterium]|nr:2-phospho-L-lactate guanylyltransferase [Candidatus Tectomicrobia bacterium]